jgi:hypothetical protein
MDKVQLKKITVTGFSFGKDFTQGLQISDLTRENKLELCTETLQVGKVHSNANS